jgi:hypothetical protein
MIVHFKKRVVWFKSSQSYIEPNAGPCIYTDRELCVHTLRKLNMDWILVFSRRMDFPLSIVSFNSYRNLQCFIFGEIDLYIHICTYIYMPFIYIKVLYFSKRKNMHLTYKSRSSSIIHFWCGYYGVITCFIVYKWSLPTILSLIGNNVMHQAITAAPYRKIQQVCISYA